MSPTTNSRMTTTISLAISLLLGWVVISAMVWELAADTGPVLQPVRIPIEANPPKVTPRAASDLSAPARLPLPPESQLPDQVVESPSMAEAEMPVSTPKPVSDPVPEPAPDLAPPPPDERKNPHVSDMIPQMSARPAQPVTPQPVVPDRDTMREGRALLRLLERGEGPDIEIAWPSGRTEQADLYRLFKSCFGMQTVVADRSGRLYLPGHAAGQAWQPDGDRYSGYARAPRGRLPADEQAIVARIRAQHGLTSGRVLRVFPREVDAMLLGALSAVATEDYRAGNAFRATYRVASRGVLISDIRVNSRALGEPVLLAYRAAGC